jgi:recombinational DNA repair protein (RecF pathway)
MLETHKAHILSLAPSGESFLKLTALSAEAGAFYCLKRVSKKNPLKDTPDLFDTAEIDLEISKQGSTRFVRDYRTLERRSAIGQNYRKLQAASEFSALLARNAPQMGDSAHLFQLVQRSLDAFCERAHPSIVRLKSVYLLLKDEGYPVRESWWPQLPSPLRNAAKTILNQPTPDSVDSVLEKNCQALSEHLDAWLQRETDLILP